MEEVKLLFCYRIVNRSHAVGYAIVSARTAWLAAHYPVEYMTANLNSYIKNSDRIRLYMSVCRQKNIEVLPPDVNRSQELFSVEGPDIRFGLRGIKHMGKFSRQLIDVRESHGTFGSLQDLVETMARHANIDSRNLEAMIYSGSVDSYVGTRQAKIEAMEDYLNLGRQVKTRVKGGQADIWDLLAQDETLKALTTYGLIEREEMDRQFKLEREYEYAQFYMSEHPIDQYADLFATELKGVENISYIVDSALNEDEMEIASLAALEVDEVYLESKQLDTYQDGDEVEVAGVLKGVEVKYTRKDKKPMAIFEIEDRTGVIRGVCFTEMYERYVDLLESGTVVRLKGQLKVDDFGCQIMAESFISLSEVKDRNPLQRIELVGAKNIELAREQYKKVRDTLKERYVGQTNLVFLLPDGDTFKAFNLPSGVEVSVASIHALKQIMGEQGTRFVYAS